MLSQYDYRHCAPSGALFGRRRREGKIVMLQRDARVVRREALERDERYSQR
jgi:hypothetical protein